MEKKNRLPEFWAVQKDSRNPDWVKVIEYQNKIVKNDSVTWRNGCKEGMYYGFDGSRVAFGHEGYRISTNFNDFKNNPTILTIPEFIELSQDVEEPTPADTFQKITDSLAKVLREKNKRYGNSALAPLEIFGGKSKVGTRLDDKISRIKASTTLRKNDVVDLAGYLILIMQENGWDDFMDQLD